MQQFFIIVILSINFKISSDVFFLRKFSSSFLCLSFYNFFLVCFLNSFKMLNRSTVFFLSFKLQKYHVESLFYPFNQAPEWQT